MNRIVIGLVESPGGGVDRLSGVHGATAMSPRCESTIALAAADGDLEGEGFSNLQRVAGPSALRPLARLRVRDTDLVICDGAGLALYSLRITPTILAWDQRVISFPRAEELRALHERPDWARRARRLCLTSAEARSCRVPVGVVAAEARGAEELGALEDGEEAVYRLSEAAAARHMTLGKVAARVGRHHRGDVEKARRPSHVPLHRMQAALAEEMALGHSLTAMCSRSPGFSDSEEPAKVTNLICRRLGLLGHRDHTGRVRYARVSSDSTALLLCEALDMAPEQVGL